MNQEIESYTGFTLMEVLITMLILSMILLVISFTLNTLIFVSLRTDLSVRTRDEIDTSLEVMRRVVKQADPEAITLLSTGHYKYFDPALSKVMIDPTGQGGTPSDVNEVHILSSAGGRVVCFGAFEVLGAVGDDVQGYLVKSSMSVANYTEATCLDSSKVEYQKNAMVLNSDLVDVDEFKIGFDTGVGQNGYVQIRISGKPVRWPGREGPKLLTRETIVSTGKLTID